LTRFNDAEDDDDDADADSDGDVDLASAILGSGFGALHLKQTALKE
jgi:hypothetical protein